MTIENALFAVQRGGTLFKCKGSELQDKLKSNDLVPCQQGSVQHTMDLDDIELLTEDVSEREFRHLRRLDTNPNNGVYVKKSNTFFVGEWSFVGGGGSKSYAYWDDGNESTVIQRGNFRGAIALTYAQDANKLLGTDAVSGDLKVYERDADTLNSGYKGNEEFLGLGLAFSINNPDGITKYGFVKQTEAYRLYIYDDHDVFVADQPSEVKSLSFSLDLAVQKIIASDELGLVMAISSSRIFQFDLNNPSECKEIYHNAGGNPQFQNIYILDGYYYIICNQRKIVWAKLGETGVTYTIPKQVGEKDWGFYPPDTKSISGSFDEIFIGGQYGALYTCKVTDPNPANWVWSEELHYTDEGTPLLFLQMTTNGLGDIFMGASDNHYISTVPKLLIPCTDEDGVTKSVTGAQFKALFPSKPPEPSSTAWERWLFGAVGGNCYIEVIVTEEDACSVGGHDRLWNADTQEEIAVSRKAIRTAKEGIKNAKENSRMKRHIEAYKESEEFKKLSEEEQKQRLEELKAERGSSYYYYYLGGGEALPIGRWIIGGTKYINFSNSDGDFEIGPDCNFSRISSLQRPHRLGIFSGASSFSNKGKPLPDLDVSEVGPRGLNYLFNGTRLNDDLSHWCVPLHTPAGTVGTQQLGTDPIWGTCNGAPGQPVSDPFIELAWGTYCYMGLQEGQDKDDYRYKGWEIEGPPGSPPTRSNCLFVKKPHDEGVGTHSDYEFMGNAPIGGYCKVKGVIYKITEGGDATQWAVSNRTNWVYLQLSGINGSPDPDFFAMMNTNAGASREYWQGLFKFWFDPWRDTNPWQE